MQAPQQVEYMQQAPVTMQPTMVATQASTTVIVNQQPALSSNWDSGLFGCCNDIYSMCCSIFCGTSYYGSLANSMGENCCVGCSGDLFGIVPGGHMAMRSAFRNKHGIPGSICDDCMVMTFCLPCGMCQLARQMKQYGYPSTCC